MLSEKKLLENQIQTGAKNAYKYTTLNYGNL